VRVEDGRLRVTLPDGPGRRAQRLTELLAAAPLSTWDVAMVDLPVADDLGDAVHAGWAQAALNQGDAEWGRALGLLQLLPREEAEAYAAAAGDPLVAAEPLDWTWGPELSQAVVAAIRPGARFVGYRLDPATDVEPLRERGMGRLCDLVAVRAAMLSEFA
jgi:hypothetical protein